MDGNKIDVFAKNLEVTDRIHEYVTRKVSKLDRFLPGIEETRIDLAYEKSARSAEDRQIAQITVRGRGTVLRTEERANDIFEAIDAAVDKMQRKMERYKGKRYLNRGDRISVADVVQEPPETVETEEAPVIARRKQFTLVPMDEMEAIEQMDLLGHESFFVFYNVDTSAINVLYRRRNGTFGLIQPVIG